MKSITRSPIAWLLLIILSIAAAILTVHLFPRAFAIVQLDVSMDRVQALHEAHILAQSLHLGPTHAQQAASFVTDETVKTFVELEGGGLSALTTMIDQQLYQPYTWQVRHFKPYDAHELHIKYTPNGKPYGFIEAIPENRLGNNVSETQAQQIAEAFAREKWHLDLTPFALIEPSKEVRPNGRIDHTFVYQRTDATIGEGFYRLRIVVTGDTVTQLNHFVQVPDNFIRRFQHMRTANDAIAWVARLLILFLYIVGGIIGLIMLMRHGWVLWRLPLLSGLLIATLQLLVHINSLPLLWMYYKTALSPLSFLLTITTSAAYQFVYTTLLYTIIFAAAESLTRKAFGDQPQFWQVWTAGSGASYQIFGRTLLGYLVVPFVMLFVITFYIIVNAYAHWWIPSQAFFEPDVLATYLPWLSSLSQALSAGFMEECLFRAIPLAGAALLGRQYGYQSAWMIGTFIIQALIFGAGHANYPMQPAYARLIELLVPSFGFGALYLAYGLLPGIIAHVVYDIAWMALPIFVSHSTQALNNKIMVILLGALPLFILLYHRIRQGYWSELPHALYNKLWRPSISIDQRDTQIPVPQPVYIKNAIISTCWILGAVGLIAWWVFTPFNSDAPTITIDRHMAQQIAHQHLAQQNVTLDAPWHTLTKVCDDEYASVQHRFIWQEGTKNIYRRMLGTYLTPPHFIVRRAQFEGDLSKRAEEYRVHIDGTGAILQVQHKLPESEPGKNLTQQEARALVHTALQQLYGIDGTQLVEIGASAQKQPARTDWKFTFADNHDYPLPSGQQRILIELAGDQLVNYKKFMFVPEEWQRTHENSITIAAIIKQLSGLLIYLLFILAALTSLWYFAYSPQTIGSCLLLPLIIFIIIFVLKIMNTMPSIAYDFNTCKPWRVQLYMTLGSLLIGAVVQAAALAFTVCITQTLYRYSYLANTMRIRIGIDRRGPVHLLLSPYMTRIIMALDLGFIFAGCMAVAQWALPAVKPLWTTYTYINTIIPSCDYLSVHLISYISFTLLVLLAISVANHSVRYHARHHLWVPLFLTACGFVFAGAYYADNIPLLITIGTGLSLLLIISFYTLLRFDYTLIPVTTATYTALTLLQEGGFAVYPHLPLYAFITIATISILSIGWYHALNRNQTM